MQLNLNAHHIVLYSVAIALALVGVYLIEARVADNATAKANAAEGKAELIAQQNKEFQTQVAQQVQQLVLQNAQLQQANQALSAQIAQTNAILAQQKKTDASLPPTELAKRIVTLAPGGSITVQTNGYLVDQPEAVAIAQTLEEVPALNANVKALESENANLSTVVANDSKTLDLEKQSHASDVTSLNAVIAADKVVLAATKAECRKSKLRIAAVAYAAGYITGKFGKFFGF